MSAKLEALVKLHEDVVRLRDELGSRFEKLDSLILAEIIDERDRVVRSRHTATIVRGTPCVAEVARTGDAPLTQPAEPVDSSHMIPPDVLLRTDRGGE